MQYYKTQDKKIELLKMKFILEKYKELFKALKEYDETGEFPFYRKKINLTLSAEIVNKLKELRKKTGKPISRIIEEKFANS
jgi:hypothetical protein